MGDIYEAKWQVAVDGVVSTVNMHFEQTAGGDTATISQSAGVAIQAQLSSPYSAILAVDARIEALYTRKVTGTTRPAWQGNFNSLSGSHFGTDAISAQNCLLINLRNSAGLLKRSGRWFISGCPKDGLVDGFWDPTFLSGPVAAFLAAALTIPAGGTDGWAGELRVLRNYIDGAKQTPPVVVPVTSLDSTAELGTIMSRKGIYSGFATDISFPL